jgi:hypothetical protein
MVTKKTSKVEDKQVKVESNTNKVEEKRLPKSKREIVTSEPMKDITITDNTGNKYSLSHISQNDISKHIQGIKLAGEYYTKDDVIRVGVREKDRKMYSKCKEHWYEMVKVK